MVTVKNRYGESVRVAEWSKGELILKDWTPITPYKVGDKFINHNGDLCVITASNNVE